MGDFAFRRVVPGTYAVSQAGVATKGTVVRVRGVGWFVEFTDKTLVIARTRVAARLACRAYLGTGSIPNSMPDVTVSGGPV